jgi:excisionase family DNA binding protein
MMERRLLSVDEVAVYLGLGSRFAVYHLISSGQLAAVRLGRRIRVDLRDLDAMIENAKTVAPPRMPSAGRRIVSRGVPMQLAPLKRRARRRSSPGPPDGAC